MDDVYIPIKRKVQMSNLAGRTLTFFLVDITTGGAQKVFITLMNGLAQKNYKVVLLLGSLEGDLLEEINSKIKIIDLNSVKLGASSWRNGFCTVIALYRYLRTCRPEIVISTLTGGNLSLIISNLLSRSKSKIIVREAVTLNNTKSKLRKKAIKTLYPFADKVVVLTDYMRSEMVDNLKLPTSKITVIGNSVDGKRINSLANEKLDLAGSSIHNPFILVVGRLEQQKNLERLILAFSKLESRFKYDLVIIGEGSDRIKLEKLIAQNELKNKVFLLGLKSNPYPWYKAASFFALPSLWEGYPNALIEALHFGLPVLVAEYDSSVQGILRDVPAENYRIISPRYVGSIVTGLEKLLDSEKVVRSYGGDDSNSVVEKFESIWNDF